MVFLSFYFGFIVNLKVTYGHYCNWYIYIYIYIYKKKTLWRVDNSRAVEQHVQCYLATKHRLLWLCMKSFGVPDVMGGVCPICSTGLASTTMFLFLSTLNSALITSKIQTSSYDLFFLHNWSLTFWLLFFIFKLFIKLQIFFNFTIPFFNLSYYKYFLISPPMIF